MDYILSNDWLLFPMIAYIALVLLKWQYVIRKIPMMNRHLHKLHPKWPSALIWFLHIWIPLFLIPCAFIVVPFAIFREGAAFWKPYSDQHMIELAQEIAGEHAD